MGPEQPAAGRSSRRIDLVAVHFRSSGRCPAQLGVTIMEVLVAVIVLSVGLLGLAGLHLTGMRQAQSAQSLNLATQLAEEMAERMRANIPGVKAGHYGAISVANTSCDALSTCPTTTTRGCYGEDCTTNNAAVSGADVEAWHRKVCTLLPCGATATVTCNAAPCVDGSRHDIRLSWSDVTQKEGTTSHKREAATEARTLVLSFNPISPLQ